MDPTQFLLRALLGLTAGCVGGLAGLGGSIIMIPALAMFWGYRDQEHKTEHHVYMAAAMCVNVIVALSSSVLHARKKAARRDVLIALIPSMVVGMISGVLLSNQSKGSWALWGFAAFIWLYCVYNIVTTVRGAPDRPDDAPSPARYKIVLVGVFVGAVAGYLGIGGGILLVPLLTLIGLPLRHAIAASAGAMMISSIVGAGMKLSALPGLGLSIGGALGFAIPMGMGAIIGAYLGATVAHKLRLPHLKLAIALILAVSSIKMVS